MLDYFMFPPFIFFTDSNLVIILLVIVESRRYTRIQVFRVYVVAFFRTAPSVGRVFSFLKEKNTYGTV